MQDIIEEHYKTKTQEAVNLRVGAGIIDYLLFVGLTVVYIIVFGEKEGSTLRVTGIKATFPIFLWILYFIVFELLFEGSIGNKLVGLKVISQDENRVSFSQVLKRRIADILDIWWCSGLLGFILIRNTVYNQRLGDLWARTLVVKS